MRMLIANMVMLAFSLVAIIIVVGIIAIIVHLVRNNGNAAGNSNVKRLCRSQTDKRICGVCGGIAEYLNIDPLIIRLLWALITVFLYGGGLLIYIICAIAIPKEM